MHPIYPTNSDSSIHREAIQELVSFHGGVAPLLYSKQPYFLDKPVFSERFRLTMAIPSSIAGSFLGEMSCSCWLGCCCTVHKSFEVSTSAETPRPRDRAKWNYVWRNRRLLYLNDTKTHIICSQRRRPHPAKPWCERKKSTAFPEYI